MIAFSPFTKSSTGNQSDPKLIPDTKTRRRMQISFTNENTITDFQMLKLRQAAEPHHPTKQAYITHENRYYI